MHRIRLAVDLTLRGPILTHASGAGDLGIDAAVATLPDGRCYLPFSLVKGRVRQSWDELELEGGEEWFGTRRGGWSATRGRFRFSDFVEVPSVARAASLHTTQRRHRIRIDEETGAADDGALQVIESPFAAGELVRFQGEVSFFDTTGDGQRVQANLEQALRWTTSLGAERSIGFGRIADVRVSDATAGEAVEPIGTDHAVYDYVITLRDPFCLARRRIAENLFETDEVIPGSAIRGVAATTLNEILGRKTSDVIDAVSTDDEQWSALARHFNAISISHAFPSSGSRPVEPPLSTVRTQTTAQGQTKEFYDIALQPGPGLIGGEAPQFPIDWKGDALRRLRDGYGWPDLGAQKEIRVRTAIDRERRRSKEKQLFSYEMIRPGDVKWRGRVSFAAIPEADRAAVIAQFQRLFDYEPATWGKTKARGRLSLIPVALASNHDQGPIADSQFVITLQTPALLCDPNGLDERSGRDALFAAYASAWHDISGGSVRLVRFFAQQSLAGGYLVHRFGAGERYAPFLLTNPGSVFVLEAVGEGAREFLAKIEMQGLPLPAWAIARHGEHWTRNPFLPGDGFGEVAIDLPCHRQPIPDFALVEPWEQKWSPPVGESSRPIDAKNVAARELPVAPRVEEDRIGATKPVPFEQRWEITATIRTTTDLHLGSGERLSDRSSRISADGIVVPIEVSAVAADSTGRAYLPGSGIKGAFRSWLFDRLPKQRERIEHLFGVGGDSERSRGGKVDVHDAHAAADQPELDAVPDWNPARLTGVTASAAIDRRTRTAQDEKLFHREYVPVGVSFEVRLTGDGWSADEAALLVFALRGFEAAPPVQLGAETREGWGRFSKSSITVKGTTAAAWRRDANAFEDRTAEVDEKAKQFAAQSDGRLRFSMDIAFSGPFLVNEPSRTKQGREGVDGLPNHAERIGTDGKVVLPVSSFRGALRSRAEKIVRTLGKKACAATNPKDACKAIDSAAGAGTLCLVCQIFGAPGWATPMTFGTFELINTPPSFEQELVAVDRFTGGVSGSAKFNAKAVWKPSFRSSIAIDMARWEKANLGADLADAAVGLLLLALRDLQDGDLTLGFGASKGYGACTATVDWPATAATLVDAFHRHLGVKRVAPIGNEPSQSQTTADFPKEIAPSAPASDDKRFYNPYHFVPVGTKTPESVDLGQVESIPQLSHASWAEETFSGRMICRVTTLTPLVLGAKQTPRPNQPAAVEPFRHPDTGRPAIPATSLRGLFSSIAEGASNSALRVLEDKTLYRGSVKKGVKVDGTVHDFFEKISKELLPMNSARVRLSIAEQLFGFVKDGDAQDAKARALAGKVRFSMAVSTCEDAYLPAVPLKILSSPKPPSPALYFRPAGAPGYISKTALSLAAHRPQGRKAYLHHAAAWHGSPWKTADATQNPDQKNEVTPVRPDTELLFHVDFDNLTPMQLGLLCYAIRPTATFRHKLGMGKSLGLGSVRVDPLALLFVDRKARYASSWEEIERYHWCEVLQDRASWSVAYPEEAKSASKHGSHPDLTFGKSREKFRKEMQTLEPSIVAAIETVGDPALWPHPVHTPQIENLSLESETFKWFVRNDSGNVAPQFLRPVEPGRDGTLSRAFNPAVAHWQQPLPPPVVVPNVPPPAAPPAGPLVQRWTQVTLVYEPQSRTIIATTRDGMSARRRAAPTDDDVLRIATAAPVQEVRVRRELNSYIIFSITFA